MYVAKKILFNKSDRYYTSFGGTNHEFPFARSYDNRKKKLKIYKIKQYKKI